MYSFLSLKKEGELPITDERMTRFMISLDQAVKLVWHAFKDMVGGEIYVKKIPSIKVTDIANIIAPRAKIKIIGIRPGEKLHEQMISSEDSDYTYEYKDYYKILPQILRELGADVVSIAVTPDGFNINEECGSTKPEKAQKAVLENCADIGICLDGDADRVLFIDEQGKLANGDQVIGLLARAWMEKNLLNKSTVVATVMSNLALEQYLEKIGVSLIRTQVGDKNVSKCMNREGLNLGGEQSGHLILSDYSDAGDGLITSLQVLSVLVESKKKASKIFDLFNPFPQSLINIDADQCNDFQKNEHIRNRLEELQSSLRGEGRILIRRSGTENVIRVMVEHKEENKLKETVDTCVSILKKEGV